MSQRGLKLTKWVAGVAVSSLAVGLLFAAIQTGKTDQIEVDSAAQLPAEVRPAASPDRIAPAQLDWVVTPTAAKALIDQGATILDARGTKGLNSRTLEGAVAVTWQQFSQSDRPNKGKLLEEDAALSQKLQQVGISNSQPVVVVADPVQGWGEEGRIVWMLRTLGHQQAVMVDGGYQALVNAGVPVSRKVATASETPGDFIVNRTDEWEIERDQLQDVLTEKNREKLVILDVRERREYDGQTPYGEQRGGHVPGAVHLHYKDLLDAEGRLLSRAAILAKLAEQGITPDAEIVTYCTAGIRSGWVTSVLTDLGFRAKNYAGSMWEWTSAAAEQYPLVTQ